VKLVHLVGFITKKFVTMHGHTICCCITGTYNKIFIVLTYNFSKEHYVLPEDDLRIETCRSILNVLV